jgi:hypothetical protein
MAIRLTLDVFSGRPNPTAEVDGPEAQELLERLAPARRLEDGEPDLPPEPVLGYHGVIVALTAEHAAAPDLPAQFRVAGGDIFGRGVAHRARDEAIEQFLVSPGGPFRAAEVGVELFERVPEQVDLFREWRLLWPIEILWPLVAVEQVCLWPPVRAGLVECACPVAVQQRLQLCRRHARVTNSRFAHQTAG